MIYGNGAPIIDAFCNVNGVWKRPLEVFGWTPANALIKAWPQNVAPDPLTGVVVSPSSQGWTLVSGQYRATFSAAPVGGSGNFSYNWTVSGGASILSGQGTASVTISDTVNDRRATVTCTMTDLTLGGTASGTGTAGTSAPQLFATVSPANRTWSGSAGSFSTTFSVTPTGGLGTYSYNWSATGGATIASGQGTANVTISGSADGKASTVTCTVTSGSQSVSSSGAVAAASIAALGLTLTPSSQNWSGSAGSYSASVQANPTGGSGSYGYAWTVTGATIASGQGTANITLSSVTGQSASISCTITDTVLGGTKSASSSIAAKALSASIAPVSLSGAGTGATVSASGTATINVSGGSGSYTYQWKFEGGDGAGSITNPNSKTSGFSGNPAVGTTGNFWFSATVTDTVTGETAVTGGLQVVLTRNYLPLSASVSPTALSGSSTSEPVETTGSATVSVSGGSGNFTYYWYYNNVGTGGINPVSQTATTKFRTGAINAGQTYTAGWFCRVTDTVTGLTADTAAVTVSLTCNYADLSVTASPASLSGTGDNTPVVTSGAATVATSGGSGNFSYQWEWDGGAASGNIAPTNGFAQSTTFQSGDTQAAGTTRGAGFRCRVTDNVTGQVRVSNSVGINLTRNAAVIPLRLEIYPESQPWSYDSPPRASFSLQAYGGRAPYTYGFDDTGPTPVPPGDYYGQSKTFTSTLGREDAYVNGWVRDADGQYISVGASITGLE